MKKMILYLSVGGSSSSFARSIVIPLKFNSSSGRFRASQAGVRRTGSVESFLPVKAKLSLIVSSFLLKHQKCSKISTNVSTVLVALEGGNKLKP